MREAREVNASGLGGVKVGRAGRADMVGSVGVGGVSNGADGPGENRPFLSVRLRSCSKSFCWIHQFVAPRYNTTTYALDAVAVDAFSLQRWRWHRRITAAAVLIGVVAVLPHHRRLQLQRWRSLQSTDRPRNSKFTRLTYGDFLMDKSSGKSWTGDGVDRRQISMGGVDEESPDRRRGLACNQIQKLFELTVKGKSVLVVMQMSVH